MNTNIVNTILKKADIKSLEQLLKQGLSPDFITDENTKETLLIYSIIKKMLPMQQLLLNYGANPNLCDKNNCSPLYYSLKYYNNNSVALLSSYQANTDSIKILTDIVLEERGRSSDDKIPDSIVYLEDMVGEFKSAGLEGNVVATVEQNLLSVDLNKIQKDHLTNKKTKKI